MVFEKNSSKKKDGTRILKQYNLLKREFIDVTNKEMIEN